jgi:diguanylate cyclase (GGDEF)-like protein
MIWIKTMSSTAPNGSPSGMPFATGATSQPGHGAINTLSPRIHQQLLVQSGRILLVEPNACEATRLRNLFTTADMQVHEVADLITALRVLPTYQPDLILAQMRLHAHSALELVRRVKQDHTAGLTPVILYCDAATAEQRDQAFDEGAADFVCKPFAGIELLARVRAALKIRSTITSLEQQAYIDRLTGLANRHVFEDQFAREWNACRRQNAPLSLIVVDLDHFKSINDKHGHPAGDDVLRHSARVLARSVRRSDLVARYGGEEFVVLAASCSLAAALAVAERFRAGLAEQPVSARGTKIPISASAGIASADWTRDTPSNLLCRADQALYEAKKSGRDAVWIHDPTRSSPSVAIASGARVAEP